METAGWTEKLFPEVPPTGWVEKVRPLATSGEMLKAFEKFVPVTGFVGVDAEKYATATNLYRAPLTEARFIVQPEKVATPATARTEYPTLAAVTAPVQMIWALDAFW